MLKKVYISLTLAGLILTPAAAVGADAPFDPFEGITSGIAQGMEVGGQIAMDSYFEDEQAVHGGNVIIGEPGMEVKQAAAVDGDVTLNTEYGDGNTQGLNVIQGQIAILALQGASIGNNLTIESDHSTESVQGVNVYREIP